MSEGTVPVPTYLPTLPVFKKVLVPTYSSLAGAKVTMRKGTYCDVQFVHNLTNYHNLLFLAAVTFLYPLKQQLALSYKNLKHANKLKIQGKVRFLVIIN
jgi:hypothetical protein